MIFSFLSTFLVLLFVFFIGTVICFGMRTITIPFFVCSQSRNAVERKRERPCIVLINGKLELKKQKQKHNKNPLKFGL